MALRIVVGVLCLLLISVDGFPGPGHPGRCPPNWFRLSGPTGDNRTHCAWVSRDFGRWIEAHSWCKAMGGQLAEIHTAMDNMAISHAIKSLNSGKYWIGLSDAETEFDFRWITSNTRLSAEMQYVFASASRGGPSKNCVAMDDTGKWYDEDCKADMRFVCQKII